MNESHAVETVYKGETLCEVTATQKAALMAPSSEAISPAVSPPISPSTEENNKVNLTIDSDGNKCGNQSGNQPSKPDCYKCRYRSQLLGDAHSACLHPLASPMLGMLFMFGHSEAKTMQFHIRGNTHGVRSGWFLWPLNYDPVWLEICSGFEQK